MAGTVHTGNIGDSIRITGAFTADGDGDAPGAVLLRVRNPDGSIGTVETTAGTATGVYSGTVVAGTVGVHWARIEGTSPVQAASEQRFEVRPSKF